MRYHSNSHDYAHVEVRLEAQPNREPVHETMSRELECSEEATLWMTYVCANGPFTDSVDGHVPFQDVEENESKGEPIHYILDLDMKLNRYLD